MTSPFSIVFEDNHLFVLNKPAGLLTQPSGTEQDSLEQQAKAWLKEAYQKPGNVFLEAVHRLDKPVSGLVVFGKTSKALSRLNTAIRAKQTKKFYYAWVDRPPPSLAGMLENFLIHDDFHAQVVSSSHPKGKLARLSYRLVESRGAGALLEIDLETGRYHQIRVQLATIGCPIRGDHRYGSQQAFEPHAIALHHGCLQIPHPITQELCTFEALLPSSFVFP
ncbi:RNA pseudouridylate synthase family protein [Candidatus Protochlamydia naegleriophila]|uniref:RNA pseudouridylate synthase family protein n=1 Tax=Candidatus Protochlamydia naegleriophila TaxID=389348 RepID=A0A0U5JEZ5_9BACT|nr:RNA pseudouridine synthase [Candidatus Protochlamydia naegleriophila]CUI17735.1 RNA pseudouridylate synthase family protein [Candidatus Protochlamydia naegleriophila]